MVYLIHFHKPYKNCRHYIGYSKDEETFKRRIYHHRKGSGAKIMRAVTLAGINWRVIRTWPDKDGHFERELKNKKNHGLLCPVCCKRITKSKIRAKKKRAIQLRKQNRLLKKQPL